MGIANASAALDEGARILDGSLGGLGGCPFAPGATGNVVFEDLAFLCESKGFETGIDIEKLVAVRAILREAMPNEPLYGGLARPARACRPDPAPMAAKTRSVSGDSQHRLKRDDASTDHRAKVASRAAATHCRPR